MDRWGHQSGNENYTLSGNVRISGVASGDILRANYQNGMYSIEDNGTVGAQTSSGANNNQGPGGGEYYFGDNFNGQQHSEITIGGVALLPGSGEVVTTAFDVTDTYSGGVLWLNNSTGSRSRGYRVFDSGVFGGSPATFGKSAGLGDLELICSATPIQIGNYVWAEEGTPDGIQRACEDGVDDVIIKLYDDAGLLVGLDTTANDGQYYFDDTNVDVTGVNPDGSPMTSFTGLTEGEKYFIVIMGDAYDDVEDELTVDGMTYRSPETIPVKEPTPTRTTPTPPK